MSKEKNVLKNPKIVTFITNGAYSLPNFRGPLMRAMIQNGWRVYALAPDHDSYTRGRLEDMGVTPIDIPMDRTGINPARDLVDMFRLAKILRGIRPQLSLCFFIKPVIFGSLAALLAGVPRRYSMIEGLGHSFMSTTKRLSIKQQLLRLGVKLLLSIGFLACHGVIFLNNEDRFEFTKSRLLSVKKTLRTKGIGVDLDEFSQLSWPNGSITFLLAARLLRSKGIVEYAEAAKIVKSVHPEVQFILLGGVDTNPEGLSLNEVESLVQEAKIEWHGHVNDVIPYLGRCSVFVLPSYYREGIPRSLQEALACGRAIITTNNVGCRETVVDGVNGFLVPVRDSQKLAEAMLRLVNDPALAQAFGVQSRLLAERDFDVKRINEEVIAFI